MKFLCLSQNTSLFRRVPKLAWDQICYAPTLGSKIPDDGQEEKKKFLRREREKGAAKATAVQQQQDQVSTILGGKNEFFLHSVCEHDKESANHFVLLDNEGMRSKEEHESSLLVVVMVPLMLAICMYYSIMPH